MAHKQLINSPSASISPLLGYKKISRSGPQSTPLLVALKNPRIAPISIELQRTTRRHDSVMTLMRNLHHYIILILAASHLAVSQSTPQTQYIVVQICLSSTWECEEIILAEYRRIQLGDGTWGIETKRSEVFQMATVDLLKGCSQAVCLSKYHSSFTDPRWVPVTSMGIRLMGFVCRADVMRIRHMRWNVFTKKLAELESDAFKIFDDTGKSGMLNPRLFCAC